jgi:hypothetical protein
MENDNNNLELLNIDYVKSLDLAEFSAWIALSHRNVLEHYGIDLDKEQIISIANTYIEYFISPYKENDKPLNVINFQSLKRK